MRRHHLLVVLLFSATPLLASDADVFRLNYRKAPASKSTAAPTPTTTTRTDAVRRGGPPSAMFTASTRLGSR